MIRMANKRQRKDLALQRGGAHSLDQQGPDDDEVVAQGNEIGHQLEKLGHGVNRKEEAGKEDAGQQRHHDNQERFLLRVCDRGGKKPDAQPGEDEEARKQEDRAQGRPVSGP